LREADPDVGVVRGPLLVLHEHENVTLLGLLP
jgi:hypothetical protein